MRNRPILITGCQRSGTTLIHLILDSHPEIHGIDEMLYRESDLGKYLTQPEFGPQVALKLPQYASKTEWIRSRHPSLRVIWCVRDPRDVAASMLSLRLRIGAKEPTPWLRHPNGAGIEFTNCVPALPAPATRTLRHHLDRYRSIQETPPNDRTREDDLFVAALCWRIKNELLTVYATLGIDVWMVRYEALVTRPRSEIGKLLNHLTLDWHDDVLKHHTLHRGIHPGKTDCSHPITAARVGRWKSDLSPSESDFVWELNGELAERLSRETSRNATDRPQD